MLGRVEQSRREEGRGKAGDPQHRVLHKPAWLLWNTVQGRCEVVRDHGFGVRALGSDLPLLTLFV